MEQAAQTVYCLRCATLCPHIKQNEAFRTGFIFIDGAKYRVGICGTLSQAEAAATNDEEE